MDTETETDTAALAWPAGTSLRRPTTRDLHGVADLVIATDVDDYGAPDFTVDELRRDWEGMELTQDAWVVETAENAIVGYAGVWHRRHVCVEALAVVHPDWRGRSLGSRLIALAEARARGHVALAPEGTRVTFALFAAHVNGPARQLLQGAGYTWTRSLWRMVVDLDAEQVEPAWPEGIALRPFAPGRDDRAVFDAVDEAFADHWGHVPGTFEEWRRRAIEREGFDPSLVLVAWDGERIAGVARCHDQHELAMGWVATLAVRRPWRRHGLGLALLRQAFRVFYRRGQMRVGLMVDSENLSGATRLYERAGMRVDRQYDRYEKVLREGHELSATATPEP